MAMIPYKNFIEADQRDNFYKPLVYTVKKRKKEYQYCDDIFCFDIEVCNFYYDPKSKKVYSINDIFEVCNYNPEKIEAMFDTLQPGALPYIWQFSINDWILYGRDLPEFLDVTKYLSEKVEGAAVQINVHNLSYEYTFLREHIKFTKKFFTDARKPLFVRYGTMTFRCTYRLTGLSLAKWGEQIGVPKKVGLLDYHALYTPLSDLPENALTYCEYDLRVMIAGLRKYRAEYKHMADIPYTLTGVPRRDIRELNKSVRGFNRHVAKCQPKDVESWKVLHATYCGGLTLCNPDRAGYVIQCHDKNVPGYINVGTDQEPVAQRGFDRKSAYPAEMMNKYPNSEFYLTQTAPSWHDGNHHICLCEFVNLRARYNITPLSAAKRIMITGATYNSDGLAKNNGKVLRCDRIALYCTEIDYDLICHFYTFDDCIIHSHRIATSDWMPRHVVEYMLTLYHDKTLRKTDPDPTFYNLQKSKLNSIYGLCGTALVHDDIIEDGWEYVTKFKNDAEILKELKRLQDFDDNNVLPYSWGIYITSHQRYALMDMALKLDINKLSYTDTDSLKGDYGLDTVALVNAINNDIIKWTQWRCDQQEIPYSMTCPEDAKGRKQHLGTWENDANYTYEVAYLGAKRYCYQNKPTDTVHITIAGVPKAAGTCMQSCAELREGLTFDFFQSRKNLALYIDGDNPQITMPDGYQVTNKCGCIIRPTSYKLTLEDEYRKLIKYYISQKNR